MSLSVTMGEGSAGGLLGDSQADNTGIGSCGAGGSVSDAAGQKRQAPTNRPRDQEKSDGGDAGPRDHGATPGRRRTDGVSRQRTRTRRPTVNTARSAEEHRQVEGKERKRSAHRPTTPNRLNGLCRRSAFRSIAAGRTHRRERVRVTLPPLRLNVLHPQYGHGVTISGMSSCGKKVHSEYILISDNHPNELETSESKPIPTRT